MKKNKREWTHSSDDLTNSFFWLAVPRYSAIQSGSVCQVLNTTLCMIRQGSKSKSIELTQTVQYNMLFSSKSMAACKLNPLPATPFSSQGMIGRPIGWVVETFRKASYSAERVTEVSVKVYEVFSLLTLQLFNLRSILHVQSFTCLQLHERDKSAIKKDTYYLCGDHLCFHLFNFNIRCVIT
jgi:hypothetical protein